jgi:hypothetical protein
MRYGMGNQIRPMIPTSSRLALAVSVWVFVSFSSKAALAQVQTMPYQIAGEFSALGLDRGPNGENTGAAGIGLRTEVTLGPGVEFETRLTWFPAALVQEFQAQGGRTLQAAAGIRGKLWASPRVSVYALLLPGFIHATDAVVARTGTRTSGGVTHFSLDTGGGIEWYGGERWTARAEISGPLYAAPGGEIDRLAGADGKAITLNVLARFVNPWQVSTGIGYRFGRKQTVPSTRSVLGRWEIGGGVANTTAFDAHPFSTGFQQTPALGLFVSYRLAPAIYADGAVHVSFQPVATTSFEGGHMWQTLGGAKIGVRRNSYGIFGKLRAGVNSYSGAFASGDTVTGAVATRRSNVRALDMGVVFERYLHRGWLVRFDGGDVLAFYRPTTVTIDGVPFQNGAPPRADSIQMVAGVGWRF